MTSESAKVLEQRLKDYRELTSQLDVLEKQIQKVTDEQKRSASYCVCFIRFTRFNVAPGPGTEPVVEIPLGAPGGGAVILDRELLQFMAVKLREARDLVAERINKIPDFEKK